MPEVHTASGRGETLVNFADPGFRKLKCPERPSPAKLLSVQVLVQSSVTA